MIPILHGGSPHKIEVIFLPILAITDPPNSTAPSSFTHFMVAWRKSLTSSELARYASSNFDAASKSSDDLCILKSYILLCGIIREAQRHRHRRTEQAHQSTKNRKTLACSRKQVQNTHGTSTEQTWKHQSNNTPKHQKSPQLTNAQSTGYGASLGGPTTLKRNILRVFHVQIYKYLRRFLVKTRNRKQLI